MAPSRSTTTWGSLEGAIDARSLTEIPGVGNRLSAIVEELVRSGRSSAHEELRARFPETVLDLFQVRGLGAKKVARLYHELGIDGLDALEAAARAERIRSLSGFGAKSEERILAAIPRARERTDYRVPATEPLPTTRPGTAGRVWLGTSGYAYPEWKGSFYASDLAPDRFLAAYASSFSAVEINNTFYRFPTPRSFDEWLPAVPETFRFAVKANLRITHRHRLHDVTETTDAFLRRCQRLGARLGPILFQLPPDFERDDRRLDAFLELLPRTVRCALEFRHHSWHDNAVRDRLERGEVAFVISDEERLPPPRWVTTDFAYLRWRRQEYSEADLDGWRSWIAERAAEGVELFGFLKHEEDGSSPEPALRRLGS